MPIAKYYDETYNLPFNMYTFTQIWKDVKTPSDAKNKIEEDVKKEQIKLDKDKLIRFCQGLQSASPIDSFVVPYPWAMPGYNDEVIMAAGAFNQGSSIELSADAPIKEPYVVYMQGGLTFEAGKIGVMKAVSDMLK